MVITFELLDILVIDPNASMRAILSGMLQGADAIGQITETASWAEARAFLREKPRVCVITGPGASEIGAPEVMPRGFREPGLPIPTIAVIDDADRARVSCAIRSGALDCIPLPLLTGKILEHAILRAIGLHAVQEDRSRSLRRREMLIGHLDDALRQSSDADEIVRAALSELGSSLAADRCYFIAIDPYENACRIAQDWARDGLESIAGLYRLSEFDCLYGLLRGGETVVHRDALADTRIGPVGNKLARLGSRSAIRVPLMNEGRMTSVLSIAMAETPRDWAADEVELVEAVAAHLSTVAETARHLEREHRIATTLQRALIPTPPDRIPGMEIGFFYQAALREANVGGDFVDVFSLEKDVSVIVIGDVSGKGLAAAAQVATVRNMLRGVLYLGHQPVEAITLLNTMLADRELVSGFVTLFAGIYRASTHELTYVSCGHEPALLIDRGGSLELLGPTGPVLGAFSNSVFRHATVTLDAGSTLLLYTDGLSEAGPSRDRLLGLEGIRCILQAIGPCGGPRGIAERLAAEVIDFAEGGTHDDICILAAAID